MLSSSPFIATSTSSLLSVHTSFIRPFSSRIFTSTTVGFTQTSVTASPARACASRNLKTVFCAYVPMTQPKTSIIIRISFFIFFCDFMLICRKGMRKKYTNRRNNSSNNDTKPYPIWRHPKNFHY
ncbi:hypothetical protein GAO43_12820 [Bacteroides thetaiotaomicron]|uniref:Uncharacterized protein n=1 Tax=Bacteroides thetaiotaomicron TaxID=818 RepID=A0A414HGI2_BACT4|nr:hypothetical protein GAO47_06475 [Bacteroides thetaiotaomicron]KAB4275566.1 hypothetical protein GAO40_03930 [Bacteroides thetaiotaomicron]KAB4279938.1 hypothetical protein GAO35_10220 [Bacteroides thetaiotaomicron]KAB4286255.1 hypothetical protein GAO48_10970 [Bacteroides thetaiotaomicron]KAB4295738.1 hypothetical protein GAO45_03930 [Bacteroides thetaiotaomicron]